MIDCPFHDRLTAINLRSTPDFFPGTIHAPSEGDGTILVSRRTDVGIATNGLKRGTWDGLSNTEIRDQEV